MNSIIGFFIRYESNVIVFQHDFVCQDAVQQVPDCIMKKFSDIFNGFQMIHFFSVTGKDPVFVFGEGLLFRHGLFLLKKRGGN
jgi:hypothetical protein